MMTQDFAHPQIVSRDEWLVARETLLVHEKELTKHQDKISAERRRLPMIKVEKTYTFNGSEGKRSLYDLFDGYSQLIVYHFMFDPSWDDGYMGCTGFVNDLGNLSELQVRKTQFVIISRAPLEKLLSYKLVWVGNVPGIQHLIPILIRTSKLRLMVGKGMD